MFTVIVENDIGTQTYIGSVKSIYSLKRGHSQFDCSDSSVTVLLYESQDDKKAFAALIKGSKAYVMNEQGKTVATIK